MLGYIYKITNIKNGKVYIGATNNPSRRWEDHKRGAKSDQHKRLYEAMRLDGIENFKFEIIKECNIDQLLQVESETIDEFDSTDTSKGYNAPNGLSIGIKTTQIKDDLNDFSYTKSISYYTEYLWYEDFYKENAIYNIHKQETNILTSETDDRGVLWKDVSKLGGKFKDFDNYQVSANAEIRNKKTLKLIKNPPTIKGKDGNYTSFYLPETYARLFDCDNFNEALKKYIPWTYTDYQNGLLWAKRKKLNANDYYSIESLNINEMIQLNLFNKKENPENNNLVFYKTNQKPSLEELALKELNLRLDESFGFTIRSTDLTLRIDMDRMWTILSLIKCKDSSDEKTIEIFEKFKDLIGPLVKSIFEEFADELESLGISNTKFIYESEVYHKYKKEYCLL